jgi:transcriptional regulator with XRE-family HTH domain
VTAAAPPLSPNARALAELGRKRGFPELAARIGVSEAALRHIARGRRTPREQLRTDLAKAYGLPLDGWEPIPPAAASPNTAAAAPGRPQDASAGARRAWVPPNAPAPVQGAARERPLLERYRDLAAHLEAQLATARADKSTATRDVAALGQALARTLAHIGRITGEHEITEAMVLKHPAFARALAVLREAVRPYPDAARAVAAAFQKMTGGLE